MKNILRKALVIFIALCMFPYVTLAENSTATEYGSNNGFSMVQLNEYEELLSRLNIIETGEEYQPDSLVTKGDLLIAILKMMKIDVDFYNSGEQIFFDVSPTSYDAPYVEAGYELGIVSGDGTGFLGIYDNINNHTAAVMICRGLRYEPIADAAGGYPSGYDKVASNLELYNGVVGLNGYLTSRGMARMLNNALVANTFTSTSIGKYEINEEGSIIGSLYGIEYVVGVVTCDMRGNLNSGQASTLSRINIGGNFYDVPDEYATDYLGYRIKAYYEIDEDDGVNNIIYMFEYKNDVLMLKSDDVEEYSPGYIRYSDDSRYRDADISPYAITIKNGSIYNVSEGTSPVKNGKYTLIDNNGDGDFDVVIINEYTTILVKGVSLTNEDIYDKGGTMISLDEYERYDLYNATGEKITLENIMEDDVLRIEDTEDKSYIIITACRDVRSTKVTSLETETVNGYTYYIYEIDNGEKIRTSADYGKFNTPLLVRAGYDYTFYFDLDGNIVYAKVGASAMQYGMLIDWKVYDGDFDRVLRLKILTPSGQIEKFTFEEKIRVTDAGKKMTPDEVNARISEKQLIRYRANEENVLQEIEFAVDSNAKKGFTKIGKVSDNATSYKSRYYSAMSLIGGTVAVNKSTIVFICPSDGMEERYVAGGVSLLANQGYYPSAEGYCSIEANTAYSEVVIIPKNADEIVAGTSPVMVVSGISQVYDEQKEEVVTAISGFYNGEFVEYKLAGWVEPKCYLTGIDIEEGDVIRYEMGSGNYLTVMQIVFDRNTELMYNTSGVAVGNDEVEFGQNIKLTYGTVESFVDKFIKIDGYDYMYNLSTSSTKVYEYDESIRRGDLKVISTNEIVSKAENPGITDKALIVSNYQNPLCVVVYKK